MSKKECKWFSVCSMKFYWQQGKIDEIWIKNYCLGNWDKCIRYQKKEAGIFYLDYLMPDGTLNNKLK